MHNWDRNIAGRLERISARSRVKSVVPVFVLKIETMYSCSFKKQKKKKNEGNKLAVQTIIRKQIQAQR